jgi:hypothetical protein
MAGQHRFPSAIALLAAALAAGPAANAQTQAAPAESLFEEGRALLVQGKFELACAKFAESERLDPAVGTLLNLGDCYEKMGKIATAWAVFKEATVMAHTAKQENREKLAAARASAIEPKVPRLSIGVRHAVPGLEVRRDGVLVGEAQWSGSAPSAVAIDPGEHEIVAVAPGKRAWSTKIVLAADGQATAVDVPELEADELAERAPLKPAGSQAAMSLEVVNTHDRNVQRAIGLAVGGAGLVTLIVGIPFAFIANSQNKVAEGECPTNSTCHEPNGTHTTGENSAAQSAVSDALISTILVVGGAGIAVAGAVVYFTAPKPKHEPAPAPKVTFRISPDLGPGSGGLHISGSF